MNANFTSVGYGGRHSPRGPQRRQAAALTLVLCALLLASGSGKEGVCAGQRSAPNIVLILADDLGYGDVRCLNPEGKIATPHLDRLAASGMRFTDAHSSSAVCTPTRYGLLTGRYNWRTPLQKGVLGGYSARLIEPGRLTVASLLQQHGYHTACVGKWHLGMNWAFRRGAAPFELQRNEGEIGADVDYRQAIKGGPTAVGFDYYYGISASLDMPPYVFIENDRCVGLPSVEKTYIRSGPAHKDFEAIDVLPTLTRKATEYVEQRAEAARRGAPFLLYFPLNAPHTPIAPGPEWKGKSGINEYADFVMQVDWTVGQVLTALDRQGLAENTLVVFTSDNGCSPSAKFDELAAKGHNPSHVFRGNKADIYDGGHRVPFIVRWPKRVPAGARCDQIVCLTDVMATCATIVGAALPDNAAEDSVSLLPALTGAARQPLREAVVHHSINGSFSIRQGQWKLELCSGSGGWSKPKPGSAEARGLPKVQLYDLSTDIGERRNVFAEHPEIVAQLTKLLEKYVADGRSTPGARQPNAVPVDIWRAEQAAAKPPKKPHDAKKGGSPTP